MLQIQRFTRKYLTIYVTNPTIYVTNPTIYVTYQTTYVSSPTIFGRCPIIFLTYSTIFVTYPTHLNILICSNLEVENWLLEVFSLRHVVNLKRKKKTLLWIWFQLCLKNIRGYWWQNETVTHNLFGKKNITADEIHLMPG